MKIGQATTATIDDLRIRVEAETAQSGSLEHAAQTLVRVLHEEFDDSVVLARTFLTIPFSALPAFNREFVEKLAETAGAGSALKPETAVLSLIGTHGQEDQWNDRRSSEGHVGIPLISAAFVESIPMISRLLKELGVPLSWVDTRDSDIVETLGGSAGLFFVENAAEATDSEGRKIIAAQEFVAKYGVRGVFGVAGPYFGDHMLVTVLFCRDAFSRTDAERFTGLIDSFRAGTRELLENGKIFVGG